MVRKFRKASALLLKEIHKIDDALQLTVVDNFIIKAFQAVFEKDYTTHSI